MSVSWRADRWVRCCNRAALTVDPLVPSCRAISPSNIDSTALHQSRARSVKVTSAKLVPNHGPTREFTQATCSLTGGSVVVSVPR